MLQSTQSKELIPFLLDFKGETEKAILVGLKGCAWWFPKSQIKVGRKFTTKERNKEEKEMLEVSIPKWLLEVNKVAVQPLRKEKKPVTHRTDAQKKAIEDKRCAKTKSAARSKNCCVGYFDGAITYNPNGTMGWGAVIFKNGELFKESSDGIKEKEGNSNNVAEYNGLLTLLSIVGNFNVREITIYGDNKMVINQMKGKSPIKSGSYVPIALLVRRKLNELISEGRKIKFEWIPREENEYADILSKKYTKA